MISTNNGNVRAPGIQTRGHIQNKVYAAGVATGKIDEAEAAQLQQMRIDDMAVLTGAKGSGDVVGPAERLVVRHDVRQTSKQLAEFLHN